MTSLLHHFPANTPFEQRMQRAEFDYIANSAVGSAGVAENYVGLPY